jgi:hypothetical protein
VPSLFPRPIVAALSLLSLTCGDGPMRNGPVDSGVASGDVSGPTRAVDSGVAAGNRSCTPQPNTCTVSPDCAVNEVCVVSGKYTYACVPSVGLGQPCRFSQRPSYQPAPCYSNCAPELICLGEPATCYTNDCQGVCVNRLGESGDPCNTYDVGCATDAGVCDLLPDAGGVGRCR